MSDSILNVVTTRKSVELATSLARVATADAKSSWILYKRERFSQAVYLFQQSVEKSAKSVGLLSGALHPNHQDLLREVGHNSILGVLLHLPERLEKASTLLPFLKGAMNQVIEKPEVQSTGLSKLLQLIVDNMKVGDSKAAANAIVQMRSIDAARLWSLTLELDPSHELTKRIFEMLKEADEKNRQTDEGEVLLGKFQRLILKALRVKGNLKENADMMEYLLNIHGRAAPEIMPLGLVSMCHEKETRYPPIGPNDYWDPSAYTADKGLIRHFPELQRHTLRLCKSVTCGALAASREYQKSSRSSVNAA